MRHIAPVLLLILVLVGTLVGAAPAAATAQDQTAVATTSLQNRIGFRRFVARRTPPRQTRCMARLIRRESGWNRFARNPSSGAYGIPQALPGWKMSSAGSDWAWNGYTQIRWMLRYVHGRYGTPCGAWAHSLRYGWY